MLNHYILAGKSLLISILLFCYAASWAQTGSAIEEGKIHVVLSEAVALAVESRKPTKKVTGEISTGIQDIDHFNQLYKVSEFTRVFPFAGKNEPRHRKYGLHRWYELKLKTRGKEAEAVKSYRSLRQIEKAELVYKKSIITDGTPKVVLAKGPVRPSSSALPAASNDPLLPDQWNYNNTGQAGGTPTADIGLLEAWKIQAGRPEVVVAVIDGGIETTHPDLEDNIWINEDEVPGNGIDDDANGYIDDVHGYSFVSQAGHINPENHGTHVAGTIAAVTNNGIGVAGIAGGSGNNDGAQLMSCAVFSGDYQGGFAESFVYAADNGATISQNSWGYGAPGMYEQVVLDAINYFIAEAGKDINGNQIGPMNGGLVVFAAGNSSSSDEYYPAFYPPVLAVAATTHRDLKAYYSNFGSWVDIAAPGGETIESANQGVLSTLTGSQYGFYQGTSMACPHVTGVAALVLSSFGGEGFNPDALRKRITQTATNIDDLNPDYRGKLGTGRIDAAKSLQHTDGVPPSPINDLVVVKSAIGEVTLGWTTPSEVGSFIAHYDVRYSPSPITEVNFESAFPGGLFAPTAGAGEAERHVVQNLPGGTTFYFAVKSIDFEKNVSKISNVVSYKTDLAPVIAVSTTNLSRTLLTAQIRTETFRIFNLGKVPLKFQLANAQLENDFATCAPEEGTIRPGHKADITVTFDANKLVDGSYIKNLSIVSNDPLKKEAVVKLTLTVKPNGFPIAQGDFRELNFKSVKVGQNAIKQIRVYNAGSNALKIGSISYSNPAFSTVGNNNISVPSFTEFMLTVKFAPSIVGKTGATMELKTNDPRNARIRIKLSGEGSLLEPISISPARIESIAQMGNIGQQTITLTNNSSYDRKFSIENIFKRFYFDTPAIMQQTNAKTSKDSLNSFLQKRQAFLSKVKSGEIKIDTLLKAVGTTANTAVAQQHMAVTTNDLDYNEGFEGMNLGSVNGQKGWFAYPGWDVSASNPDDSRRHLRGLAQSPGVLTYVVSPMTTTWEDWENGNIKWYATGSCRINTANAGGATWEVIFQDFDFVITRLRINPDRTLDLMATGPYYSTLWNRLDVDLSPGYFEVTLEMFSAGMNEIAFIPFQFFINGKRVFRGYSMGGIINNMAFTCTTEETGGTLDIDNLHFSTDLYTPQFIEAVPDTGIIPAKQSVEVKLNIDPAGLKFATYESAIETYIDETDTISIPCTTSVHGEGVLLIQYANNRVSVGPGPDDGSTAEFFLVNAGGKTIEYTLETNRPYLQTHAWEQYIPLGTIPSDGGVEVHVYFSSLPSVGVYFDTLTIRTNIPEHPVYYVPLEVTVFQYTEFHTSAKRLHFESYAGSVEANTFHIWKTALLEPGMESAEPGVTQADWNYNGHLGYRIVVPTEAKGLHVLPLAGTIRNSSLVPITVTLDPSEFAEGPGQTYFTIETTDVAQRRVRVDVSYNILGSTKHGKVNYDTWTSQPGKAISDIPVGSPPSTTGYLTSLQIPTNMGDEYGTRLRGFIRPPVTGKYTFWISSDDASELWLGKNDLPSSKVRIAYINKSVRPGVYDKFPSQKSTAIALEKDRLYYVEVLHKENYGADHLSVGWQLPGGEREFPIPGTRLSAFEVSSEPNKNPSVRLLTPENSQLFLAPATVQLRAEALDEDGDISKVQFYAGDRLLFEDASAPYQYSFPTADAGWLRITARAVDDKGAIGSKSVFVLVTPREYSCLNRETIQREVWRNIPGKELSSIPFQTEPSEQSILGSFSAPLNEGDNYGSRIRGYFCPPISGTYTFWITSDDFSELWLSIDDMPENKKRIAYVKGYAAPDQWDKYYSQRSAKIQLDDTRRYYIEAIHKEASGLDHLAVGVESPYGLERPIPGWYLIPFQEAFNPRFPTTTSEMSAINDEVEEYDITLDDVAGELELFPNPVKDGMLSVGLTNVMQDNLPARCAIVSMTGIVVQTIEPDSSWSNGVATIKLDNKIPEGVYLFMISLGERKYFRRFILIR